MAAGKTLESTIELSGILSPSLMKTFDRAVDELNKLSSETLESADAATRLLAEMDAQEDILQTLQRAYAGYAAQGEEASEEAQTLAKRIQTVSDELGDNKEVLEAAERATKQLTAAQDDGGDAFAKLEKTINSQETELAALRREYANVALTQGKNSKEAKELKAKINSLSGELVENKQKLNAAEDAAEKLGKSLDEAGEKAENSSGGFTVLKGAIADLAADAISAAIDAFKELAFEGDNALAMLEAKTGATAEEMKGFEDVMYEVYDANYGESLGDVSEKLSTVIQMTDNLDNASLAKVTKQAIALEDVFGFDVTESMRAANSLMDQFGITSDEAFNLVIQGAQNGLDQNGDLLDTINEYSVQFRTAGYSAEDMFNMMLNGAEAGTWSVDKLGDAVKEFNIRMSDGSAEEYLESLGINADWAMNKFSKGGKRAQAAVDTIMEALVNCDDATLQYQAGVGLFGTMFEDLGADTVAALMETQGGIDSTADAMAQLDSAAYDTLESSLSQLGRTVEAEVVRPISDKLIPVAQAAVDFVNTAVAPAVDWILNNLPTLATIMAGIAAAVTAFKWSSIVSGIMSAVSAFKAFGAVLAANPIGLIIIGITALVAGFVYLWNNCEGFRNFWINLWDKIKTAFFATVEWLKGALSGIASFFSETWSKISGFCSTAWNTIKNAVQVGVMLVGSILSAAFNIITLPFRFIWENCKDTVLSVWNKIKTAVSTAINAVKSVIIPIVTTIRSFMATAWAAISAKVSAAVNTVKTTVSAVWNGIKSITSTVWNAIKSAVSTVWSAISSRVSGAINAVKSTISGVWNSIKSVTSSVWNGIKNAIITPIETAKDKIKAIIDKIKGFFSNMKLSLPKIKLPHFSVEGKLSLNPPSVPKLKIDWYKEGGIMTQPTIFGASGNTLMAGGEAGAEAVLPLSLLWDKMEAVMKSILNSAADAPGDAGLTSKAGELLTLDNFSLGSLADGTNCVIYYDFSGFTWSPQIHTEGGGDDEDDIMARLKAHEAEFFDWLEEFVQMREVATFA